MSPDPTYFIYILQSQLSGEWAIGMTEDLLGDLRAYNAGKKGSIGHAPWSLIFVRTMDDRILAVAFENELKANQKKPDILGQYAEYFRFGLYPGKETREMGQKMSWVNFTLN